MNKSFLGIVLLFTYTLPYAMISSNEPSLKKKYIDTYKVLAVEQMKLYGIPASITLAQGMLESGYGESTLAKQSNNHFGVKCHSDWQGGRTYANDDQANECFRVYPTVGDSYEDHSKFLLKNKRYASLFQLDKKDYKGWAHGLKSAGYATNPQYATLLISLIEESALHEIDQEDQALFIKPTQNISVIHIHENKVRYVLAEKGDTYYKISQRTGLTLRQLRLYNESFHQRDILKEGDKIYLDPRRKRSKTKAIITLTKNMTLREIAQEEALTVKSLLRKNQGVTADETLSKGKEIRLK